MADEGYQPFPDISAWTAVPFDPTTYDQYAALLEEARADATEEAREHAVKTAMRYAGTDTGAIEGLYTTDRGFTRTVAIEAAGWEAAANERGPNAAEVIKDQIAAYEWVLDLVTQERPLTEHVIRELHAMLCRSQDTYVVHTEVGPQERALPKGEYKTHPNNPTSLATGRIHHYAPPDMVSPEMGRLVGSLTTDEYRNAHPVVQAAYLHYALAAIHPFADGNGRVARAIASVPLYRDVRVPLVVLSDERDEYLDALEATDGGALDRFVAFVEARAVEFVELVRATVALGPVRADRERSLAALGRAALGVGGLPNAELEAAAARLLDELRWAVKTQMEQAVLPSSVTFDISRHSGWPAEPLPPGYRLMAPSTVDVLTVDSATPRARVRPFLGVLISIDDANPGFLLVADAACPPLPLPLAEVVPVVRKIADLKIAHWVSCVIDTALADLAELATGSSG